MQYAAEMNPDEFTRWIFPRLYRARVPRYEAITAPHGYRVTAQVASQVRDGDDFLDMLEQAIADGA